MIFERGTALRLCAFPSHLQGTRSGIRHLRILRPGCCYGMRVLHPGWFYGTERSRPTFFGRPFLTVIPNAAGRLFLPLSLLRSKIPIRSERRRPADVRNLSSLPPRIISATRTWQLPFTAKLPPNSSPRRPAPADRTPPQTLP